MERESEAVYLKQVSIFNGLNDEEVHDLISAAKRRTFRSGEVIFHRDDPGQMLYIIKEGKVKICLISQTAKKSPWLFLAKENTSVNLPCWMASPDPPMLSR
jgi:CRP/FNR family transcriptional regulator, cyclic AMP receptor protein